MCPIVGGAALQELPEDLGLPLFTLLRRVRLWADPSPSERERGAIGWPAGVPEEIRSALPTLERAYTRKPPRAAEVRRAALKVSRWALERGYLGTARAWAEVAAVADPTSAEAHYRAGRLARRQAEYHAAEGWLLRAMQVGRRYRQWTPYVKAQISMGNMHAQRGMYGEARSMLTAALQAAEKPARGVSAAGGFGDLQRRALHDLMSVSIDSGDYAAAEEYARKALPLTPPQHPRLPNLAHDTAVSWLMRGQTERAAVVLVAAVPHMRDAVERGLGWANLAWAEAVRGRQDAHLHALAQSWALIGRRPVGNVPAWAFLALARGAAHLARWEEAERLAERAALAARERAEADRVADVAALRVRIGGRCRPVVLEATPPAREVLASNALAVELIRAVSWSAA